MSGIQLGEKQITLEDCDAIIFDRVPVVVDPSFVAKVNMFILLLVMDRSKRRERESTLPQKPLRKCSFVHFNK